MKQLRLVASLSLLFLVACSSAAPTVTPTPSPTAIPTATATSAATSTPHQPSAPTREPTPTLAPTVPPTVPPTATATATATPQPTPTPAPTATSMPTLDPALTENVNALLLVPNRYGANYYLNIDNFELYGWNVIRAGVRESIQPCSSFAAPHGCPALTVDLLVSDVGDVSAYDALVIMPSQKGVTEPYGDILKSQAAMDLVVSAVEEGLAVYAPCAGVRVLAAAGVLDGRAVTGAPGQRGEYEAAGATYLGDELPPVIDGNIVTTRRGMYYNVQNCAAIATILENSQDASAEVPEKPTLTQSGSFERDDALWTRTFGGLSAEGGRSVSGTSDGGSIIAGYTYSFGAGQADVYLLKTDAEGNAQWSRAYGGPGWEYGFAVSQTRDEGYVLAGYTTSYGAGSQDVYLLKTDSQGNALWSKTFGGPGLDVGRSVIETRDGDYVVAGYTESFDVPESDVYVIKTDSQGNELWSKTFGGPGPDVGQSVIEVDDGGYVVAGASGSFGSGNQDVYLLKTSADGQELWARALNPGVYDWGKAVRETSDGGYIIVGDTTGPSLSSGELLDFFLLKTDAQGYETWTTIFGRGGFYDHGNAVYETGDGDYIAVGTAKSAGGNNDVYLVKVDSRGSVVWKDALGGRGSDWGSAVYVTKDGDYVIAGHTSSHGAGTFDVWLVKVAGVEGE